MKLVVRESESDALWRYVRRGVSLATSHLALVEVRRATSLANPSDETRQDAERIVRSCLLIDVSDAVLRTAAELASASIRALDAIHLATAVRLEADELIAYDRRLISAAEEQGLRVVTPSD